MVVAIVFFRLLSGDVRGLGCWTHGGCRRGYCNDSVDGRDEAGIIEVEARFGPQGHGGVGCRGELDDGCSAEGRGGGCVPVCCVGDRLYCNGCGAGKGGCY